MITGKPKTISSGVAMRFNSLLLIGMLTTIIGHGQTVKFNQISAKESTSGFTEYTYSIEIFNNTNIPFCFPVSLDFGLLANTEDTLEVVNIYPASDSLFTFSLYYLKSSIEGSSTRYPALPIVLNPNSYFRTNVRFNSKISINKVYLELKCSYEKSLNAQSIYSTFEKQPKYAWMNNLKFIDIKYPVRQVLN